jgi:hypothetical protein
LTDLRLYRLKGSTPTLETDAAVWGRWMASAGLRIRVAVTPVEGVIIHTTFTGMDLRPASAVAIRPKPRVWATTVTAPSGARLTSYDSFGATYDSRSDAAKGHDEMVTLMRRMMRKMRSNGDGPARASIH